MWNIVLPKDCRGLCYDAPNIRSIGVLDAINTTNFGAKSGSWRDAFSGCACLENLYIKNLKTSINISWSPVSVESIQFIIDNAINTSKITISVSPYTYYRLPDALKSSASEKNIVIELINTNSYDDIRFNNLQETKQDIIEDIDTIRNNANLGATALQSIPDEYLTETEMKDFEINGGEY